MESSIKQSKNTLRRDKTSRHRFAANQARLLMGVLAHSLLHMLRQFYLRGEEVKRLMEWLIKRLVKVGASVSYHGRRWNVHGASAFPLARHCRTFFSSESRQNIFDSREDRGVGSKTRRIRRCQQRYCGVADLLSHEGPSGVLLGVRGRLSRQDSGAPAPKWQHRRIILGNRPFRKR
ncbi:MAG: transposase [Desulfomonile tiedjei]|nr:transposase [Desulfomonile tiedjei]